ncbi:MAG: serine/threonine-protein kinase [Planctomycetota bacterium]
MSKLDFPTAFMASGLINDQKMDYALRVCRHRLTQQGHNPAFAVPQELLAEVLVEQEVLTKYQADQILAGRTKFDLGLYTITDWIGQGGMGQVFKGVHQVMGRECAVKVLPSARATQEARDSFGREIRMQAKLDCAFLVRAFDAGQDGSVHYLVTEYVPGMDLRRLVKSQGALPIQQAAKIIMQAALGLEYAHGEGLVHRDVKPGNILVTPDGDAKVSDVGLAGFTKEFFLDPRAGKIVGTPDYLSPEQIRSPLDIEPASDIYSLGCTLYYAVCGKVPFPGGDTESKLKRHLEEFPLHPRNFAPEITEDFVDIIVDMMEKNISRRITNAAEVAARLEPWASDAMVAPSISMTKTPWLAPPPPSHVEQPKLDEDSSSVGSSFIDGQGSTKQHSTGATHAEPPPRQNVEASAIQAPPHPHDALVQDSLTGEAEDALANDRGLSRPMLVALTIAVAVPPALLLGAIIGFLVAH